MPKSSQSSLRNLRGRKERTRRLTKAATFELVDLFDDWDSIEDIGNNSAGGSSVASDVLSEYKPMEVSRSNHCVHRLIL